MVDPRSDAEARYDEARKALLQMSQREVGYGGAVMNFVNAADALRASAPPAITAEDVRFAWSVDTQGAHDRAAERRAALQAVASLPSGNAVGVVGLTGEGP